MQSIRLILTLVMFFTFVPVPGHAWWPFGKKQPPLKERLTAEVSQRIDANKQALFDSIHPVGTAKSVKVHEVTFTWKNNKESEQESDVLTKTARYTIYWDGPIHKDGYTKLESVYDAESDRWSIKLLATSGMTKEDVSFDIGYVVGAVLAAKLQNGR